MTRVISVRGKSPQKLLSDPNFVYCGRGIWNGGMLIWKESVWGNPFRVGSTRKEAISLLGRDLDINPRLERLDARMAVIFHRAWIKEQPLMDRIGELVDKTLGCWCGSWSPGDAPIPCHAETLARLANSMRENS